MAIVVNRLRIIMMYVNSALVVLLRAFNRTISGPNQSAAFPADDSTQEIISFPRVRQLEFPRFQS